ncbi:unknown similar to AMEV165 [Adoxophyes honmai entomopoxvirus 'L']|uniref:Uncharacterized protein n=1 Tax=Adoxophyes honmai entomopoxvirus 'L' TaxID=1293540 RepID=A0A916KP65_9POXV|nr:unknown similar to AMEV165 [Adoxophyes honmai entomopoxvirus 'L']CCU55490.1 unknown similar to AMEV165 [Adoxophyes honmai entomopoxvirus 'L']
MHKKSIDEYGYAKKEPQQTAIFNQDNAESKLLQKSENKPVLPPKPTHDCKINIKNNNCLYSNNIDSEPINSLYNTQKYICNMNNTMFNEAKTEVITRQSLPLPPIPSNPLPTTQPVVCDDIPVFAKRVLPPKLSISGKFKKIFNNKTFDIIIIIFILDSIILPYVTLKNGCESQMLNIIVLLISSLYTIYFILIVMIYIKMKLYVVIKNIILLSIICIQMFIISLTSMILSTEIFDTNERCPKFSRIVIILISFLNLLWAISKNVIILINIIHGKNIIDAHTPICNYIL